MAGMLPFESPSVLESADPYISVEATAKGLAPRPYVESYNEPVRRIRPIQTSTYGCGVRFAELLAFEMYTRGGSQGLNLTDVAS
jgi:hypothetical protein